MIDHVIYISTTGTTYPEKHTKTVKYACGCTVKLGGWDESFAPFYCGKHRERIVEIVERWEEA